MLKYFFDFFFQPVHAPVNRLFGNLQMPGNLMSAIPLELHQNDLKGKPVHGDQHMTRKILYIFLHVSNANCTAYINLKLG